jgi:vancomycin resistance protein VanJ
LLDRAPPSNIRPRARRWWARVSAVGAWASLTVALLAWTILQFGDDWPPATVLLFGPRWLVAVPPALFLVPAWAAGRLPLLAVFAGLIVAIGPVMGFNVPWAQATVVPDGGPRLRIVTCNMHYERGGTDLPALIAEMRPDVVALQEWREPHGPGALDWTGWHVRRLPSLFLASRHPVARTEHLGDRSTGDQGSAAQYQLDTPAGSVTVISMHLASPREQLKGAVEARSSGLDELAVNSALRDRQLSFAFNEAARLSGPVVIGGDFNTPPDSVLVDRHWRGYRNAFADAGWGWGFTFRNRWTRVRIDHILVGGGGRASACWVGPDVGSPHRPVLADISWPPSR